MHLHLIEHRVCCEELSIKVKDPAYLFGVDGICIGSQPLVVFDSNIANGVAVLVELHKGLRTIEIRKIEVLAGESGRQQRYGDFHAVLRLALHHKRAILKQYLIGIGLGHIQGNGVFREEVFAVSVDMEILHHVIFAIKTFDGGIYIELFYCAGEVNILHFERDFFELIDVAFGVVFRPYLHIVGIPSFGNHHIFFGESAGERFGDPCQIELILPVGGLYAPSIILRMENMAYIGIDVYRVPFCLRHGGAHCHRCILLFCVQPLHHTLIERIRCRRS